MKLTDVMFNLDYIAANTGAAKEQTGKVFAYETLTADDQGQISLGAAPIPVITNGTAYLWYRKSSENKDMDKKEAPSAFLTGFEANTEYCVMYRKSVDAETITINSQFIPDTLHAVLTVALYSGDSCNVESATKAGEVVIDIPRLQLSGAMDISMSATGAAQTPLEGNALASGCTGCDGKAIYATITKYIANSHWFDAADGILVEDGEVRVKSSDQNGIIPSVYAYYKNAAPKKLATSDFKITLKENSTLFELSSDGKAIKVKSGVAAGSSEAFTVTALDATKSPAAEIVRLQCSAVAIVAE